MTGLSNEAVSQNHRDQKGKSFLVPSFSSLEKRTSSDTSAQKVASRASIQLYMVIHKDINMDIWC
jgi:hypothetical protein